MRTLIINSEQTNLASEYMYHAESLTNVLEKVTATQDHFSDNLLWQYIYTLDLINILGYKFQPQVYKYMS